MKTAIKWGHTYAFTAGILHDGVAPSKRMKAARNQADSKLTVKDKSIV